MRTSLLTRLAGVATALGLTSAALVGTAAAPAQAAVSDCPSGYFCAWKSDNATGTMYKTNVNTATLGTWDNTFRSVVNRTSKVACLYDAANYSDAEANGAMVIPSSPSGSEWGGPGSTSVSSVKFTVTERECVLPAYPDWYSAVAPKKAGFSDLNNDGQSDVVVRDTAGRLWFLPGNGTGKQVGTGWNGMDRLSRHGDFTNDTREDVVAREKSTGKLWLYPGTGAGGFTTRILIGSGGWNGMDKITAYGNITGDSRSDLLAVEKSTGKLWLYPGTSTSTATAALGARKLLGSGGWNAMNALVAPGDMNGDARADLIAREASTGKLWFYPATSTGALGTRVLIGTSGWNGLATILPVADINADGRNDLVAISASTFSKPECQGVGCLVHYTGKGTGGLNPGSPEDGNWWGLNGAF
ncbi:FG-GAP-like repeat-containing protein [Streptomyces sp. NPDC020807]|uniref:peptidase inhibitor family I36 protein n=1 Tax=Streptomyces sp. NPDC020807 TaxID=3155119 RepID=UPI0033F40540